MQWTPAKGNFYRYFSNHGNKIKLREAEIQIPPKNRQNINIVKAGNKLKLKRRTGKTKHLVIHIFLIIS